MTDAEREKAIADMGQEIIQLLAEGRKDQARVCFYTLAALMAGRSDEQIRKMEKEQGLNDGR